jgi:predicted NodU family carbamoyl transferase
VELAPEGLAPDGRAWPQIVTAESDRELHELLGRLGKESGVPLLWLTDLALRGSPLVRNEADAVEAFGRSGLDALLAGTRLYVRA